MKTSVQQKDHSLFTLQEALSQKDQTLHSLQETLALKDSSLQEKEESLQQLMGSMSQSGDQVASMQIELEALRNKEQQYLEQEEQVGLFQRFVLFLKKNLFFLYNMHAT